jgi:aldehyde:ferredoxin oxidoreductase
MTYLYGGTILRVDLSTGSIEKQSTAAYTNEWLGGRGFNTRILYKELKPGIDALSPENLLIFSVGPLTGSMFPGSGRVEVAAKSPVTGIQGMSNMGGYWGPELKYAGYDSIIVKGKAPKPVYIAINNDSIWVKDASHIWGLDTYKTQDVLQEELGDPEVEVTCIGPGSENLVAYGSIQTRMGNAAGRTGMGTVMGSKNLKAIAVRGTKGVSVADPDRFLEICLKALEVQKPLIDNARTVDMAENTPPATWAVVLGN